MSISALHVFWPCYHTRALALISASLSVDILILTLTIVRVFQGMLPAVMGPQRSFSFDKSVLQELNFQYPVINQQPPHVSHQPSQPSLETLLKQHGGVEAPLSPVEALIQIQTLQRSNMLIAQSLEQNKTHRALDRSISEPHQPANVALKDKTHAGSSQSSNRNVLNPHRYKTEMCRTFVENGVCKYGEKCQFAHGVQERRALPRHPKYKTEYCKTFHTTGICSYGARCHFIHNEDELKLSEITHMKRQQAAIQATQEMTKQAAQLRQLQKQLLQSLLVSQASQQLFTQLSTTPVVTSSAADQLLASSTQRPRLTHSMSVQAPSMRTYSLGSTADSPPESLSTSPILSPAFLHSDDSDVHSDTVSGGVMTPPILGADLNSSFSYSAGELSPLVTSPQKQQQQHQQAAAAFDSMSPRSTACRYDVTSSITNSMRALAVDQQRVTATAAKDVSARSVLGRSVSNIGDYGARPTHYNAASQQLMAEHSRLPIFNQIVGK